MPVPAFILSLWLLASQVGAGTAPDRLAAVKALYAAADYEAALIVLSTDGTGLSTAAGDQYRALCLLALGRLDEVERLLESLIVRDPSFRMSVEQVTPRMISLFQETRRRVLPGVLDDTLKAAKASFESGRYAEASTQFKAMLTLLEDEDLTSGENGIATHDLQRVAEGFLKLATTALADASKTTASDTPRPTPARGPIGDEAAIVNVVQQYAQAYSALDAEAVARVFQGENPRPLQAKFDALKSQTIEARNVKVAVDDGGWSATVRLDWVVHAIPKVGKAQKTQMPATLRMLKVVTGEWCIVARR